MRYGYEVKDGKREIYAFTTNAEREFWIFERPGRSPIAGVAAEVKKALYDGTVKIASAYEIDNE
jgi:hypothetical protein